MEEKNVLKFTPEDIEGEPQDPLQKEVKSILRAAKELFSDVPFLKGLESTLAVSKDAGTIPISEAALRYLQQAIDSRFIDEKTYRRQIVEFRLFLGSLEESHSKKI